MSAARPAGLFISFEGIEAEIALSVESNATRETDVKDQSGKWHRLQIRPYKTATEPDHEHR